MQTTSGKAGESSACLLTALLVFGAAHNTVLAHDPWHHEHGDAHPTAGPETSIRYLVTAFRETGDDRWLDAASARVESQLEQRSDDPRTLLDAAFIWQARHRFQAALASTERALSRNLAFDEAWLLAASIHLVLGEPEAAARACANLRRAPILVPVTCNARVALALEQHDRALPRLTRLLELVDDDGLEPEILAWSHAVAGDLAVAAGHYVRAAASFRRSLALAERTQVRAALIDALIADGRYEQAWQTLDGGSDALPLVVRRLIVAKRLNRLGDYRASLSTVEREFERWIAAGDWLHAREMARYYLDVVPKPALARKLALHNIAIQQEPEDIALERRSRQTPMLPVDQGLVP